MMLHDYVLPTERLILRSPNLKDVPRLALLVGDYDVAKTTLGIPHPYTEDHAINWLHRMKARVDEGATFNIFAMIHQEENTLVGVIEIGIEERHQRAELGYWVGKPYWGNGYATEATKRVIQFGYEEYDLVRVAAGYYTINPASGRVMEKCGMIYEGTYRKYMKRDDILYDVAFYSILRDEWESQQRQ